MQELRSGCTLQGGKYRIERVLGQGGYGITYEGFQTGLNRRVAIKEFFLKEYCEREGQTSHVTSGTTTAGEIVAKCREKFIKEAQMIASFDRAPHIVRIHDIFEENGTAYYVMEYVEGGSLASLVEKSGPLPVSRAINLIRQTGQALSYLHSRQTMHLDVKPANLLLRREDDGSDNVVLIDFGISKHYDAQGHATTTSFVTYSRGFASLEQYREGGVQEFSPTSDIYSLGATLYFLLTGQTPPDAMLLVEDPLERPSAINPDLWPIISHAMSTSRRKRYQTVDEMMSALKDINLATTSSPVKLATISPSKVEETTIASPKDEKTIVVPSKDKKTTIEANNLILKDNKPKPTPSVEQRENNESEEDKPSTKTRWLVVACIVAMIGIVFFFVIRGTSDITQVDTSDSQVKMDGIYEVGDLSKATDLHPVYNEEKRLWGVVDQAGRLVMPFQWEIVKGTFSKEGIMAVAKDGKWGFIDKQGNLIIPYQWYSGSVFSEGLAPVCDGNKWGFIDKTGKLVIPCRWAEAISFNEGLARVRNDDEGNGGFINKEGKFVIPCQWTPYGFWGGLAPVQDKSGLWGYVNTQGELVIGYKWAHAFLFFDGLALVTERNIKGFKFINKNGKVVLSFDGNWKARSYYSEGLAFIEDKNSHNIVCIDKSGRTVFECKWNKVYSFSDGLAAVQDDNGKWGYIDKTGTLVIPCQWDRVEDFFDGKAWVMIGTYGSNTYRQIDKTGKYVE